MMTEDLKTILIILATGIPVGLIIGVAIRRLRPTWGKSYAKFCLDGKWWLFGFGVILFIGLSVMSFGQNRVYFGILFAISALVEAVALLAFGFKRLTPEQKAKIDASEPTKLWPIRFWK